MFDPTKESLNLIQYCAVHRKWSTLLSVGAHLVSTLARGFQASPNRYPASVKAAFNSIRTSNHSAVSVEARDRPAHAPDWLRSYDDIEQTFAIHRWNWLQKESNKAHGLDLMRDWIRTMSSPRSGPAWSSYTTGERICNAVRFLDADLPADIAVAIRGMAEFLSGHIEYNGPYATGNHVINNARALYLAGQSLQRPDFAELGLAVFKNDLSPLISPDGFLREGSSHYHFLLTRWMLDVLWMADKTHDHRAHEIVAPAARLLLERCWFFLVRKAATHEWSMPRIGDVSPDCSLQDLINLPMTDAALRVRPPEDGEQPQRRFQSFPASGWHRLDCGPLTIFWHIEPGGSPRFASHGHCDTGSFCLYWKGAEVIVDPGRLNYKQDDPRGVSGISARSHNSVVVDGFEPFVYWRWTRYPEAYRTRNIEIHSSDEPDGFIFTIRHDGFSRIMEDPIVFTRTFTISTDELLIDDKFEGARRYRPHEIQTFFHWAPGSDALRARFSVDHGSSTESGYIFPDYGQMVEAPVTVCSVEALLPHAARYRLPLAT